MYAFKSKVNNTVKCDEDYLSEVYKTIYLLIDQLGNLNKKSTTILFEIKCILVIK